MNTELAKTKNEDEMLNIMQSSGHLMKFFFDKDKEGWIKYQGAISKTGEIRYGFNFLNPPDKRSRSHVFLLVKQNNSYQLKSIIHIVPFWAGPSLAPIILNESPEPKRQCIEK